MKATNPVGSFPMRCSRRIVTGAFAMLLAVSGVSCKRTVASAPPPPPNVVVVPVIQKDVPVYFEWVGTTVGYVNANIYPKVQGYLLKQNYIDGSPVKSGQLLFQIDPRQYQASLDQSLGQLAQDQAINTKNQQDLARYKPLLQQQVISRQDFDHVNQAALASAATVKSDQAAVENTRLNLGWTQVTAPIDGVAGIAKAQVGDLVSTTTLLTSVSQINPMKVTFPISEREYLHFADRIKQHEANGGPTKGESELQMILADGSTYKYPGHFYDVNRQVNVQTGTIQVQGVFPNPEEVLRPGLYAKIRTAADTLKGAILVPPDAVLETQGQYQVAVVGADDKVSIRPVTLGKRSGNLRIIETGVAPGEHVITEGLQKVSDGMQVVPTLAPEPAPANPPAAGGAASPVTPASQS
jgi:membrane fusion protein, multidrug efflux system